MRIDDVKDMLRDHAGKVMVGATGFLLVISGLCLAGSLTADGTAEAEAQAAQMIVDLKDDVATAQDDLTAAHDKLLADLPGVDMERTQRDAVIGRSVLLSLTDSSASSRNVKQTQVLLDARYDFLDETSRTLTEFIPEWMAATGSSRGVGTTYTLTDLSIDVSSVKGLDYGYVGLAQLDPVAEEGKSQFVVFRFTTTQNGTVTSFEAYRVSNRSRDALVKSQEKQEGSQDSGHASKNATGEKSKGD